MQIAALAKQQASHGQHVRKQLQGSLVQMSSLPLRKHPHGHTSYSRIPRDKKFYRPKEVCADPDHFVASTGALRDHTRLFKPSGTSGWACLRTQTPAPQLSCMHLQPQDLGFYFFQKALPCSIKVQSSASPPCSRYGVNVPKPRATGFTVFLMSQR